MPRKRPKAEPIEPVQTGCPSTNAQGVFYHGTAAKLDHWDPDKSASDYRAVHLTPDYLTAATYAQWSSNSCKSRGGDDCEPKIYRVELDSESMVDCRSPGDHYDDIIGARLEGRDGAITNGTILDSIRRGAQLPNADEYLIFKPNEVAPITGVRRVGGELPREADRSEYRWEDTPTPETAGEDFFQGLNQTPPTPDPGIADALKKYGQAKETEHGGMGMDRRPMEYRGMPNRPTYMPRRGRGGRMRY